MSVDCLLVGAAETTLRAAMAAVAVENFIILGVALSIYGI
jgi:hypothetical protein